MYEQTQNQLDQIKEQMAVLATQAQHLHNKVSVSEKIYLAEIRFQPIIGHTYYSYQKKDGTKVLSMIAPEQWEGRRYRFKGLKEK